VTTVDTHTEAERAAGPDVRSDAGRPPATPLDGFDPARLAALDAAALAQLASEIRDFLVQSVAATGGHLGSNLGVVELTLALHRVFASPTDRIIWDTGHQAYVHKLLTGRAGQFAALRQGGGLSGYPNREESEHDLVENSHASTALSYGFGLARAHAQLGEDRKVVAVIGDGALTGGLAYEALNNIGAAGTDMVIVLNDNGRSYAPTVSRLTTAGDRVGADRVGADDQPGVEREPARSFVESLGVGYLGPIDGHDVAATEAALRAAAATPGPVVVHVHTVKGRGYRPAELDDEKCLHDVGPFDPATGVTRNGTSPLSYTRAFSDALLAEAANRPELVAITAAMAGPTGLLPFLERFPDRFLDVGIAEQHAVTAAAGMAMGGLRPVVAIYSTFLNRAWDQIYCDVGLHRLPVIFCIDRAGITGDDGPSHHGVMDLALLTKVPGMTVLVPSNVDDVAAMLHQALEITTGPVAIRWPKTPGVAGQAGSGLRARRVRRGRDVCLLGVGKLLAACEHAADLLAAGGIEATVWDVRVAAPLDPVMIDDAVAHPLVLTAEDGVVEGGVGSKVAAAIGRLTGPADPVVVPCGVPLGYHPHGKADHLLAELGLDGPGLCRAVMAARRSR
jgi:1-deoxy-D-xylulose-5-phosphate synthase